MFALWPFACSYGCSAVFLPVLLLSDRRNAFLLGLTQRHFGFAGIDAFDDFFDGLVFDDEVADVDGGKNLTDQVARRDAGAVESQAAGHLVEALEMQRRRAAVAVWR